MKKLIFTTAVLLLFGSCTVTKQNKSDYSSSLQGGEGYNQIGQVTKARENKKDETKKNNVPSTMVLTQKQSDYNPYRNPREEYIKTGRDFANSYEGINCEEEIEYIKTAKNIYYSDTSSLSSRRESIIGLGRINCQEVIDFLIDVLKNDTSTDLCYDVLLCLGWYRAKSTIPFLVEFSKNVDVFFVNKIAITLCVMEEFDIAASILDRVCLNEDGSISKDCVIAYEYAGKSELTKSFWLSEWNKKDNDKDRMFGIAMKLVEHGIYDIPFPVIKETLYSTERYKRHSALSGLAAIATDEALSLIQNCINDSDVVIANHAKSIIFNLKNGRIKK